MAKRPNILKLATKISLESMTYMGITYDDPEYKILEPIIDDDMCAIMMHVRLETNRTVEEVAKRARKSVEFTQEQLDKLCKTGAVRYRYVDGKRCYFYPIWVPGIMEGILANREQCDKYPVLGESFEAYTRRRPEMLAPMLDSGKTGMFFMRVMPVMSAIENDSHAASYDEVRTLIENATAISVGPCSCRRARRLMGEGCGHLEEDMCMYLNDNAINFSKHGEHRRNHESRRLSGRHEPQRGPLVDRKVDAIAEQQDASDEDRPLEDAEPLEYLRHARQALAIGAAMSRSERLR